MSDNCFECNHYNGSYYEGCRLKGGCEFTPTLVGAITTGFTIKKSNKEEEKKYLDKLVNDHWDYIESVLYSALQYDEATEADVARIRELGFHYKSSAKHFWSHSREYHVGETL